MIDKIKNVLRQMFNIICNKIGGQTLSEARLYEKSRENFLVLKRWMLLHYKGITLNKYFTEREISKVAIYGMGDLGKLLCMELDNELVDIKYVIDRNALWVYSDIDIFELDSSISYKNVDVTILTVMMDDESLINSIKSITNSEVITLTEVIDELSCRT